MRKIFVLGFIGLFLLIGHGFYKTNQENMERLAVQKMMIARETKLPPVEIKCLGLDENGSLTVKVICPVRHCNETQLREMRIHRPWTDKHFKEQPRTEGKDEGWYIIGKYVPVDAGPH